MKKFALLTLVIFGVVLSTNAQNGKSVEFGVRAGWNYSMMTINGAQLATTDPLSSLYIGGFVEKKLTPALYIGSGLDYFENGFKSNKIDLKRKLNYLSIPLYLKVKFGRFYATGGTAFNFKVSEKNIIWEGIANPLDKFKSKTFDLPLQVGIGLRILMFSLEVRYNWGMLNVNKEARNRYLQTGLAVFF